MEFDLEMEHVPDKFFREDVKIRGRRHLIFASDKQLEILSQSKTWYMDATFKLCHHPFTQLFTVNAFVKKDNHVKQVPLAFALMSGRKKGDYKAVLQALLSILPNNPRVKKITLDFEKAMWSATRQVLPNIKLMGCSFHFTQALWRKVQEFGLQEAYAHDRGTHSYVKQLMAQPFLPTEKIETRFYRLQRRATTDSLKKFVQYVADNWIKSQIFPPTTWSVFM
ncbi:uncharacterized protein LOC122949495 [Acropora millepora]|uniref:uncharacterized protein LOC122949495 n=1 Tax=Acropora millepora TaxID=45264 RepID=UPI001CF5E1AC|nr:uncharacterized protein LOC122949495 [Acropora millepora]